MNEIAWAAGLFEGEGWIGFNRGRPAMSLNMTDQDIIIRLQDVLGGKISGPYQYKAHWTPVYSWRVYSIDDIVRIANLIFPYLGERRSNRMLEVLGL